MRYCTHCGKEIKEGTKFCPYCGAAIEEPKKKIGLRTKIYTFIIAALVVCLAVIIVVKAFQKPGHDTDVDIDIDTDTYVDADTNEYEDTEETHAQGFEIKEIEHKAEREKMESSPKELFEINESSGDGIMITKYLGSESELVISDSLSEERVYVDENVFAGNEALRRVTISNVALKTKAFYGCENLEEVTLIYDSDMMEHLTNILNEAFAGCPNLKTVHLKGKFINPASGVFSGDENLTEVDISDDVPLIADSMFSGCTALKTIHIPENCKRIGSKAFKDCTALESVDWKPQVDSSIRYQDLGYDDTFYQVFIGPEAFANCSQIRDFEIPDRADMNAGVFKGCSGIEEIVIPDGTCDSSLGIPDECFRDCTSLKKVVIDDKPFIGEENPNVLDYHEEKVVGNKSFSGCSSLEEIEIPEFFQKIQDHAFENCESLKTVVWRYDKDAKEDKYIGPEAFVGCTGLSDVYIPALNNKLKNNYLRYFFDRNTSVIIHTPKDSAMEEHAKKYNLRYVNDY